MSIEPNATPHCAVHPDAPARPAPCARCGNFACEFCFEHPAHDLCPACSEATGEMASDHFVDDKSRRRRRWIRKNPRLSGLGIMALGLGLFAMNFGLIVAMNQFYVVMFPLGGAAIGIGLSSVLTGRAGVSRPSDAPPSYWWLMIGLTVVGGLAGLALNFAV